MRTEPKQRPTLRIPSRKTLETKDINYIRHGYSGWSRHKFPDEERRILEFMGYKFGEWTDSSIQPTDNVWFLNVGYVLNGITDEEIDASLIQLWKDFHTAWDQIKRRLHDAS